MEGEGTGYDRYIMVVVVDVRKVSRLCVLEIFVESSSPRKLDIIGSTTQLVSTKPYGEPVRWLLCIPNGRALTTRWRDICFRSYWVMELGMRNSGILHYTTSRLSSLYLSDLEGTLDIHKDGKATGSLPGI